MNAFDERVDSIKGHEHTIEGDFTRMQEASTSKQEMRAALNTKKRYSTKSESSWMLAIYDMLLG